MKNIGFFLIMGGVLAGAVALSQSNVLPATDSTQSSDAPAVNPMCLDFDPPSQTETITVSGVKYLLIKKAAAVQKDKLEELTKIGTANGKTVSKVTEPNMLEQDISFIVYLDLGKTEGKSRLYDIYIKDGTAIPDYIRNCKGKGGKQVLDFSNPNQFPPQSFNRSTVTSPGAGLTSPAYIYDNIKLTLAAVKKLKGVKPAGSLFVKSKNASYQLYSHLNVAYLIEGNNAYEYLSLEEPVDDAAKGGKASLQLQTFSQVTSSTVNWWTPVCKPAIYLYPTKTENISVKVKTPGVFTLTIPSYPDGGWEVAADPDGTVHSGGQTYPYLYYETKIEDSLITVPQEGYVRTYDELSALFTEVLPKLGLNTKESKEFKEYWEKVLPYAPYYFVGVMTQREIDDLEPLEISPKPDSLVRVRLYFKGLTSRVDVSEPAITTPARNGFVVSEWGGMLKLNQGSTFTCVQ